EEYVEGESQADGVQGSWLVPISQYLTLTAGMYNKIGADNERVSNTTSRQLSDFTYLGRAATFLSLSDANSIDLGLSFAGTPRVAEDVGEPRYLGDLDLTYRWIPLGGGGIPGLLRGPGVRGNLGDRPDGGFPRQHGRHERGASGVGARPAGLHSRDRHAVPPVRPRAAGSFRAARLRAQERG